MPALRVEGTVLVSPGSLVDPDRRRDRDRDTVRGSTVPSATVPRATGSGARARDLPSRSGEELARAAALLAANGAALERSRRD
ncbi:MAG: hypothetical protein ABWY19_09040 [Marmoricola sp.]